MMMWTREGRGGGRRSLGDGRDGNRGPRVSTMAGAGSARWWITPWAFSVCACWQALGRRRWRAGEDAGVECEWEEEGLAGRGGAI